MQRSSTLMKSLETKKPAGGGAAGCSKNLIGGGEENAAILSGALGRRIGSLISLAYMTINLF